MIVPPINAINCGVSSKNIQAQKGPNTASVNIIIPTMAEGVFFAPMVIKIKPKPIWKNPAKKPSNKSCAETVIFEEIM